MAAPTSPRISVIIPTLNEADQLSTVLERVFCEDIFECIVVDGGSTDGTLKVAHELGAVVEQSPPGRASQLNAGAKRASGDLLLFLHGDTLLPAGYVGQMKRALGSKGFVLGAFPLGLNASGFGLRIVELLVRLRCFWFDMPYGDQAYFVWRRHFDAVGGFPEQPLLEDYEFLRRIRAHGAVVLTDRPVLTSARRWQKLGWRRTSAINYTIIRRYIKGTPPDELARVYRASPIDFKVRKNSESGDRTNIVSSSNELS